MILVINDYDGLYSKFWGNLGEITLDPEILFKSPEEIKLVCFTGGEDVSPALYGHKNLASHNSKSRDEKEVLIFQMAKKHKIPMTGICRGSQLLNVMCGGTMVQHLKASHGGGRHQMKAGLVDGPLMTVTSSHHQMSVLSAEGVYLGWSEQSVPVGACVYDGELDPKMCVDLDAGLENKPDHIFVTEAFAYPKHNIFAVQHHPEWQGKDEEAYQWTLQKIREICWNEGEQTLATS